MNRNVAYDSIISSLLAMLRPPSMYYGTCRGGGPKVFRDFDQLTPESSLGVENHSPTGFGWGYHGSGPAQLALALLLDVGLSEPLAVSLHQMLKRDRVAKWAFGQDWKLDGEDLVQWIKDALAPCQQWQLELDDRDIEVR